MPTTPCAACKLLRRKCTEQCVFAPYFPSEHPYKFIYVHKVFGASNVSKILTDLPPMYREAAATSLFYEAEVLLHYPVYGILGYKNDQIHYLTKLQQNIVIAKEELATYMGKDVVNPRPQVNHHPPPNLMMATKGMPHGEPSIKHEPNIYEHHPHIGEQQVMFNGYQIYNNGLVTATGFNEMDANYQAIGGSFSGPSRALGSRGDTQRRI